MLACLCFSENGKSVLYLDIDAHHGDGVQEAFYASDQVMVISLHESGKTLWPGTGFEDETGGGGGGYHVDNTVRGWAFGWKIMCGLSDESDLALGMGGVMLQSTEWAGGLRDRVMSVDENHCESVEIAVQETVRSLKGNVFKFHNI